MFSGQFWPKIGGAERQALLLSKSLRARGCRVEVLTPQLETTWALEDSIDGVPIHRFPLMDLSKRFTGIRGLGLLNTLVMGRQVRQAVMKYIGDFDILHAHIAWSMVAYAGETAQSLNKKIVCKVAAGGEAFDLGTLRRTSPLGPKLAKRLLSMVDRWIAISQQICSNIEQEGIDKNKIVRIPNGVEIPVAYPVHDRKVARRFLYLGRLSRTAHKDYLTLLRAFDRLVSRIPECELKLVGGGELSGDVHVLLQSLPHARLRTELVGFSEPTRWLQWADVLIQPSMAEGLSNALLEGIAHGLVCIANDIPPNREVLGEAGILVPVGDTDTLVQCMEKVATISSECLKWRSGGRVRAEQVYAIGRVAEDYLRLYTMMLKG